MRKKVLWKGLFLAVFLAFALNNQEVLAEDNTQNIISERESMVLINEDADTDAVIDENENIGGNTNEETTGDNADQKPVEVEVTDHRGWYSEQGEWYYYNSQGVKVNGWITMAGRTYYLDPNQAGIMAAGWKKIDGQWFYFNASGHMKTGWIRLNQKWYYLKSNGVMATGWKQDGGRWYYLNSGGEMATGWKKVDNSWYYLNSDGVMATGWKKVNGQWYLLNSSGEMVVGWKKVGGSWYYLNTSGAMATGWKKIDNHWYYLNSSGAMATGWKKVGGSWYYLNYNGIMAAKRWIGQDYVDGSGRWIEGMTGRVYNNSHGGIGSVIGTSRTTLLNWLKKHHNDSYYLGTPYRGYDNRNPRGDCSYAHGRDDRANVMGMNCTGFVWHVLWSGASIDSNMSYKTGYQKIPAMGAGEMSWRPWALNRGVRYKTYRASSTTQFGVLIDAMFQDGFIEPGDVIWLWDQASVYDSTGMPVGAYNDTHCGIYIGTALGDSSANTWWHSTSGGIYGCPSYNQISRIEPLGPCKGITVIKL